ncbi:oxygen-insensitive NADPH nitroreductase [Candidatus Pantoea edessiphila]|uniref:Oxygen-insensitive NADPH nitroreductase n=1 Tax=Candidatus Pantoea edessiphila TaxID=2044610 RepID=A0A2P5T310_9GAMM|nr:oxygen-insensitive NADPH nitroreductase [Candidatus Pantoea edessiphila]PPI88967.1 oxygen-insensitive NADPH nitroreductase [Candidatus Pantoea edessiphila]
MKSIIDLICNHRSIRSFTNQDISKEQCRQIIAAAQSASTSSFLQCYSIIRITDSCLRSKLAILSGNQQWIIKSPEFWVFCADFNRHLQIAYNAKLGYIEQLIIGCIDTAMMAQNAILAAESMNLGGVFIGGIRNNIKKVVELLNIPKFVLPLFGLCLGYPKNNIPNIKPRIPQEAIVHENCYYTTNQKVFDIYNIDIQNYYKNRSTNKRIETWNQLIQRLIVKEMRPFMIHYLHKQGWAIY